MVRIFPITAQTPGVTLSARLQRGIELYGAGRWREAVLELRRAQAEAADNGQRAESLYWIALAELAAGEYENSIKDMDELERIAPGNPRYADLSYHRGRTNYYLGRYDEALILLKAYSDSIGADVPGEGARKPAALYWMGECLYSLGHLDQAESVFLVIMEEYPQSVKYEASSYRLSLIKQKKIEAELLGILKWSHEESLKTVEEYQRRERSYDQAIIAYQKRIADMLKDSRYAELETSNAEYRRRLIEAESRIIALEASLKNANIAIPPSAALPAAPPQGDSRPSRVQSLRSEALDALNEREAGQ
jgi:tetratricopeptide (TPR) repeat protein